MYVAHKLLIFRAGILHRDISITNMMLVMGTKHPRKGFLIDFDWAIILEWWKAQQSRAASGKENTPPTRETRRSKALRIAKELEKDIPKADIRGHRTVSMKLSAFRRRS